MNCQNASPIKRQCQTYHKRSRSVNVRLGAYCAYQQDPLVLARNLSAPLNILVVHRLMLGTSLEISLPEKGSPSLKQDLVDTTRKRLDGMLVLCAKKAKLTNHGVRIVRAVISSHRSV